VQVKRLLKEKKLKMLVDPDLRNNYIHVEVKSLIKVALICTQVSPVKRPKMVEVVRMLEGGDGLAQRWEVWWKIEVVRQEVPLTSSFSLSAPNSFANNTSLCGLGTPSAPPLHPPPPYNPGRSSRTGAISGGVAAGAALLFNIPAIGFAWWRRRKPQEYFPVVPGKHPIEQGTWRTTLIQLTFPYLLQLSIQGSILASLKDFRYENFKLQQRPSTIKTFLAQAVLARSIKED
jgi:hypothetical protein